MKRVLYFGYYLKELDWKKFRKFLRYVKKARQRSRITILYDVIRSSLKYNISIMEYFLFRFYDLPHEERLKWAGTGYMYEYQKIMNPKSVREVLDDKRLFFESYKELISHKMAVGSDFDNQTDDSEAVLSNQAGKLVFKVADGKCGADVLIKDTDDLDTISVRSFMNENGYDLVEEFIVQHPDLMSLSPSAVNTIRIFTQLNALDEVEFLGCRLRISINSSVDNLAAGNIAAPVDEETGIVTGPGVYSDITKNDETNHPVTGVKIEGFKIPYWKETVEIVTRAAKLHPQNRSIGWDIAMTPAGPDLIEGNHDWCKLLWQLPVKEGMKSLLDRHLAEYKNKKSIEKTI